MKMTKYLLAALALLAPVSMSWAVTPDPESLPKVNCSDFKFSQAFLAKFPKAPAACQEGRIYKGHKYAKFNAKVYLNSPDRTTVQFMNVSGDPIETISFKPAPGATLTFNGVKTKYSDLKPGDPLTLWIPESRMTVSATPAPTAQAWTVLPPVKQ
jgi:hypothetical protein